MQRKFLKNLYLFNSSLQKWEEHEINIISHIYHCKKRDLEPYKKLFKNYLWIVYLVMI